MKSSRFYFGMFWRFIIKRLAVNFLCRRVLTKSCVWLDISTSTTTFFNSETYIWTMSNRCFSCPNYLWPLNFLYLPWHLFSTCRSSLQHGKRLLIIHNFWRCYCLRRIDKYFESYAVFLFGAQKLRYFFRAKICVIHGASCTQRTFDEFPFSTGWLLICPKVRNIFRWFKRIYKFDLGFFNNHGLIICAFIQHFFIKILNTFLIIPKCSRLIGQRVITHSRRCDGGKRHWRLAFNGADNLFVVCIEYRILTQLVDHTLN